MPTRTTRLGLWQHTTADTFEIQDYTDNWQALDAAPGIALVESTARPTSWGSAHLGRMIFEMDTRLLWYWNGSAFVRVAGRGRIANNERTAPLSTSNTSYVTVVQATTTVVAGDRPHLVMVEGPGVYNTNGVTDLALFRDNTQLQAWRQYGGVGNTGAEQPPPVFGFAFDTPTPGTYNYVLQFKAGIDFLGTSTVTAAADKPLAIHVIET